MASGVVSIDKRFGLWPMRIVWFVLPALVGFGVADAIADRSEPVQTVIEIGLWAGWFAGLVALLAPSTVSLTILRGLAPSGVVATAGLALTAGVWNPATSGAIGATIFACVLTFLPLVGDIMINGSSYGPERRMALRPPAALLIGPLQITWLLVFAGMVTGPLFLAAEQWWIGGPLTVLGLAIAVGGMRRLHTLSRRWVVFVPAGFVLHDPWALAESLLMQRRQIKVLGPAALDKGEVLDLTGGARGVALMAQLKDPTPLALRARKEIQTFEAHRLQFTPTLPGELLHEARIRGIKIGVD